MTTGPRKAASAKSRPKPTATDRVSSVERDGRGNGGVVAPRHARRAGAPRAGRARARRAGSGRLRRGCRRAAGGRGHRRAMAWLGVMAASHAAANGVERVHLHEGGDHRQGSRTRLRNVIGLGRRPFDDHEDDRPVAGAQPGQRLEVGCRRPVSGDDGQRAAVAGLAEVGGDAGEAVLAGGLQRRQVLEHGLGVDVAGAEARVGAVGREQPDERVHAMAGGMDARRRRDGELEGCRRVHPGPGVEEDRRTRLPRHLVLADHEVVEAGGRRPVHASEVVTDLVGTEGVEVLALSEQRAGVAGARVGVVPLRGGERRDDVDARVHRELGDADRGERRRRQSEGIGERDLERADVEDAPLLGR